MSAILAVLSIAALVFTIPSLSGLGWSKRTRWIIVLSIVIVLLLAVIEALYWFYRARLARQRLRHKSSLAKAAARLQLDLAKQEESLKAQYDASINDSNAKHESQVGELRAHINATYEKFRDRMQAHQKHYNKTVSGLFYKVSEQSKQIKELTIPMLTVEQQAVFLGSAATPFEKLVHRDKGFLTIILFVVNTRSENNSIKQYGLEVDVDGHPHEGEVVETSRLLLASAMREFVNLDNLRESGLEQGRPKEVWSRFCFDGSIDITDKPFVFTVTDVYNFTYVIDGRTPFTLSDDIIMKDLTPPEAYKGI